MFFNVIYASLDGKAHRIQYAFCVKELYQTLKQIAVCQPHEICNKRNIRISKKYHFNFVLKYLMFEFLFLLFVMKSFLT